MTDRGTLARGRAGEAAHYLSLGNALKSRRQWVEAIVCYREALALQPALQEALTSMGIAFWQQGQPQPAITCYRRAIALMPGDPVAHNNLGNMLLGQGLSQEAIACFHVALSLKPDYAHAHNNLGNAHKEQSRVDEAAACYRDAIGCNPGYPEAHYNLGNVLRELARLDEAVVHLQKAVDLAPGFADAWINLGNTLLEQRLADRAVGCYRTALKLQPDLPDAHFNLALALLSRGDMAAGWAEYEWRWKMPQMVEADRGFKHPRWNGEAAPGRTLLIHAEQGFGDTLQFCRYASVAADLGLRVIMVVPQALVRLLGGLRGVDAVLADGDDLPAFDLHCPMLSLPLALGHVVTTSPGAAPYLHASASMAAGWNARLAAMPGQGRRVGLVWAGSRRNEPALAAVDRRRSLDPERLAPLFDVPELRFFSLQKGGPAAPARLPLTDFMDEVQDFADTAALIANLDLVISVDTAVAHLAAAMGTPVWLLDRFNSCWRWLTGRRDSPWYPTLQIYRQPRPGEWDYVLQEVARDLGNLSNCNGTQR